jgi:hypothetical protein
VRPSNEQGPAGGPGPEIDIDEDVTPILPEPSVTRRPPRNQPARPSRRSLQSASPVESLGQAQARSAAYARYLIHREEERRRAARDLEELINRHRGHGCGVSP